MKTMFTSEHVKQLCGRLSTEEVKMYLQTTILKFFTFKSTPAFTVANSVSRILRRLCLAKVAE